MKPAVYVPPWYIAGPIQKNTQNPNQAQVQTISKTYPIDITTHLRKAYLQNQ